MSTVDVREIMKLSTADRLRLVEKIWNSILNSPQDLPLTGAQKSELDRRLADHRSDPDAGRSWEEVCESLDRDS